MAAGLELDGAVHGASGLPGAVVEGREADDAEARVRGEVLDLDAGGGEEEVEVGGCAF